MALFDPTLLRKAAVISNAVITKFALIALGAYLGMKLDEKLSSSPLFILVGIFVGGGFGLWYLFVVLKRNRMDSE